MGNTVATGMWECSPWKIESSPAASTRGATSRTEIVVSLVIRLAPMRTAGLLARRHGGGGRAAAMGSPLGAASRRHLDRLARDEPAPVRNEEEDGVGDLLRVEPRHPHRRHRLVAGAHELAG